MQWVFSTNLMNPIDSVLWTAYQERSQKVTTIESLLKHLSHKTYKNYNLDRGPDQEEQAGGEVQITEINQNLIPPPLPYQPQ